MGKSLADYATNVLPDDEYSCKILDIELKDGKDNKAPILMFKVQVKGGALDGKKGSYIRSLSDAAIPILATDLINAGVDGKETDFEALLENKRLLTQELQGMVGKVYDYTVSSRTYQGRTNNDFKLDSPSTDDDILELGMAPADV